MELEVGEIGQARSGRWEEQGSGAGGLFAEAAKERGVCGVRLSGRDFLPGDRRDEGRQELARARHPQAGEAALQFADQWVVRCQLAWVVHDPRQRRHSIEREFGTGAPGLGYDRFVARSGAEVEARRTCRGSACEPDAVAAEPNRGVAGAVPERLQ